MKIARVRHDDGVGRIRVTDEMHGALIHAEGCSNLGNGWQIADGKKTPIENEATE